MSLLRLSLLLLFLGWQPSAPAAPQFCPEGSALESQNTLKVGVKYSPPFAFSDEKKGWQGLSVDLWETIMLCLGTRHEYVEYATTDELLDAVSAHKVDVGISTISITSQREKRLDFSHAYHNGSLGIIVKDTSSNRSFADVLKKYLPLKVILSLLGLIVITIFIAYAYWSLESKRGSHLFPNGPAKGFFNSMIWTVQLVFFGRGDPFLISTRGGQLFVVLLTFFGVAIGSAVTAVLTSSLTLVGIEWHIQDMEDLKGQNVLIMGATRASDWAVREKLYVTQLRSWPQVQYELDENPKSVFVHDRDILRFLIKDRYLKGVRLEPLSFQPDAYGIALPKGSALRDPINSSLLAIKEDRLWQVLLEKYLGKK
jgi:hypothetical protein